jgi:hypothetical protein
MACVELTTGFNVDCSDAIGGLKKLWIGLYSDFATGVALDGTSGQVETLPEATIYPYELKKGQANSLEETLSNEATGSLAYNQTVNFQVQILTQRKQTELHKLAKNDLAVFVQDANNNIWFVGRLRGARLTTGTGATGTNATDYNGYTLALVAEEPARAARLENYTTDPFDNFADITIGSAV